MSGEEQGKDASFNKRGSLQRLGGGIKEKFKKLPSKWFGLVCLLLLLTLWCGQKLMLGIDPMLSHNKCT